MAIPILARAKRPSRNRSTTVVIVALRPLSCSLDELIGLPTGSAGTPADNPKQ
jgi:hypothetical protein